MANETINQQAEDNTPTSDDFLLTWDVTSGITKKASIANIITLLASGSILGGRITSTANTGSGAGTINYINLGGIKLLWGQTANQTISGSGFVQSSGFTVNLPAAFFSSIQYYTQTIGTPGNTAFGSVITTGTSTSTFTYTLIQFSGSTMQAAVNFLIIGT